MRASLPISPNRSSMSVGASASGFSDNPGLQKLVNHYDAWLRRWASLTGREPSRSAPEFSEGRLWFRDGFPHPDWTARIIQPSGYGYLVLRATTERRVSPLITIDAVFSDLEDAAKYVIMHVGDMLRRECQLEPRYREWSQLGLSGEVHKSESEQPVVDFIAEYNGVAQDSVQRFVHKYTVKTEPDRYAHLSSSEEPRSRVLTLSYDELDETLAEGLESHT